MKYFNFLICFLVFIFSTDILKAAPPDKPPKKWPCDQVYNPKLNLSSIWQGPEIEDSLKNWWKDDEVIKYVNILSNPVLKENEGVSIIDEFAKKYTYFGLLKKSTQKEKLIHLFAGLYQKAKDRRSRQYVGIIKFVERQESLRKAIGDSSKLLRKKNKN